MMIFRFCLMVVFALVLSGCNKSAQEQQDQGQQSQQQSPALTQAPASTPTSAGGIRWTVPARWNVGADRPMRVGTYAIPAADGDAEGAECAAYYFGADQGGDVQANVERWATQFEGVTGRVQTTSEIAGMKVTNVLITGTYLAPSGPMMQSQGKKENYRLIGAIVGAPEGNVFFKCTGPDKTVEAAKAEFNTLIESISKK